MRPGFRTPLLMLLAAAAPFAAPAAGSPSPNRARPAAGAASVRDTPAPPTPADAPAAADTLRAGISLGGTHRVGLSLELLRGRNSLEVSVGTFHFELLAVALTARRYLGEDRLDASIGAGLWTLLAFPGDDFGYLALFRVPVGLDWNASGNHYAGAEVSLSWAFAVRRADPEDDAPLRRHFLPLPALYYKYQRAR